MTIKELLDKIDAAFKGITTSSTIADIVLNPAQFDRYVRMLQISTSILPEARQIIMTAQKQDIDRVGFGSRVMRVPNTEGSALDSDDWATPIDEKVQLDAVEIQGIVSLTDKAARRAIERGDFENTLVDLFSEHAGIDLEELALKGDTDSSDDYLALLDGWLKTANRRVQNSTNDDISDSFTTAALETTQTLDHGQEGVPIKPGTWTLVVAGPTQKAHDDGNGNIVQDDTSGIAGTIDYRGGKVSLTGLTAETEYTYDYDQQSYNPAGDTYPEDMFEAMLVATPKAYFRMASQWRFFVTWEVENAYRNLLKGRGTALGDSVQTTMASGLAYKGVPLVVVNNMPSGRAMLGHPDNLVYGIFHQVQLEREREAKAKRTDFILNTEFDVKHEEKEASIVAIIA
jgi:hypothetical protein